MDYKKNNMSTDMEKGSTTEGPNITILIAYFRVLVPVRFFFERIYVFILTYVKYWGLTVS
jgi:hypothetical protein